MTGVLLTVIAVLGIAGVAIEQKKSTKWIDLLNLLLLSTTILLLINWDGELLSEEGKSIGFGLMAIATVSFVTSKFELLRKKFIRFVIPLVGIASLFLAFKGDRLVENGFEFGVTDALVVIGAVLAVLAYEIAALKAWVLSTWLGIQSYKIIKAVLLILSGIIIFMELFAGSHFGLLIATTAFVSSSFYREKDGKSFIYSWLIIALSGVFLREAAFENVQLVLGKVMEGLFVGAAAVYLIKIFSKATKNELFSVIIGHGLMFALLFVLFYLGTIYTGLGGADAFLGAAVGFAIANILISKRTESTALFAFILIGGMTFPALFENEELKAFEEEIAQTKSEEEDAVEPEVLPMSELNGSYQFDKESTLVSFKLGPAGAVTQGAIKKFEGEINVADDVLNTSISVEMPVTNLTTFIAMRDEEVHGEHYLNAAKFPVMTFESKKLEAVSGQENVYTATGEFTMLGVTKDQTVEIKRIKEEDKLLLIGSGKIDRREFGMTPDDKEGNIVEFNFKVQLVQK